MAIQFIEIGAEGSAGQPIVRLTEPSTGNLWQYVGACIGAIDDHREYRKAHDLNRAAEAAAAALAEKTARRNIRVELLIDPMIPLLPVEMERVVPILTSIAENASASVEPGPGTVLLQTWCTDRFVGMDAVGRNGSVPDAIRESWTLPGFSTRVADWDTGFGLHAAMEAAEAIAARLELLEDSKAVAFRLAIPIKTDTPLPSAEAMVGQPDDGLNADRVPVAYNEPPTYTLLNGFGGLENVRHDGIIQA